MRSSARSCFVPADMQIPTAKVVVGNPAQIVKDVSDEMLAWKTEGTALYRRSRRGCASRCEPCEPLREMPADRPEQQASLPDMARDQAGGPGRRRRKA